MSLTPTDAYQDRQLDLAEELVSATGKLRHKALVIRDRLNRAQPEPVNLNLAAIKRDCEVIISRITEAAQ